MTEYAVVAGKSKQEKKRMTETMNIKIKILTLCLGATMMSSIYAAGFGVSGESAQATAIDKLLMRSKNNVAQGPAYPANAMNNPDNQAALPADGSFGDTAASQQAFTQTVRNMMPLTPEQIHTLRILFDESQRAAATDPGTPPRPTSSTIMVDLSPGASPPVIRLRAGYVTSLDFLDSTGQPWPIVAYDIGNPGAFNIAPNQPDGKSDTILVEAMDQYKSGNLAVMLKGESTPIMLTLLPGQRAVDYRVDLRVPGLGPNAKPELQGLPSTENAQLINFLDGVPPQGATALQVEGSNACQAWMYNGKLYLRTRLAVISPSWTATMSSPDGTHVYELMKAAVVLASQQGQIVQLTMKGL